MLDAYGLPVVTSRQQERRLDAAREGYEAACRRRGAVCDWNGLDADTRYLWLMTADALIEHAFELQAPPLVGPVQ
jgi:hypothetical protein